MVANITSNPMLANHKRVSDDPASLQKNGKSADTSQAMLQAENVAKDFETMYVDMMMRAMRQTVKPEDESNAQGIYQGMLDQEYSKSITDSHDFGIRSMLLDWMKANDPKLSTTGNAQKALQEYKASSQLQNADLKPK